MTDAGTAPASVPVSDGSESARIASLDQCAVHKHSPTYGDKVCPDCQRFVPDAAKVLTAYRKALADAQGCTELTCMYHHHANVVRRDLEHIQRVMGWTAWAKARAT